MLEMKKDWRAQESTCERGDIAIETSRAEKQRRKRKGTSKEGTEHPRAMGQLQKYNVSVMKIPLREKGPKEICEVIKMENFPKLMSDIGTGNSRNNKQDKCPPKSAAEYHIQTVENQRKNLGRSQRGKNLLRTKDKNNIRYLLRNHAINESGMQYFKVLRHTHKKAQPRILYPVKLFKSEGETFSDKQVE